MHRDEPVFDYKGFLPTDESVPVSAVFGCQLPVTKDMLYRPVDMEEYELLERFRKALLVYKETGHPAHRATLDELKERLVKKGYKEFRKLRSQMN